MEVFSAVYLLEVVARRVSRGMNDRSERLSSLQLMPQVTKASIGFLGAETGTALVIP
jgi:hypothetical protein